MKNENIFLSAVQIATVFDVSILTIFRLQKDGLPCEKRFDGEIMFSVRDCMIWYYNDLWWYYWKKFIGEKFTDEEIRLMMRAGLTPTMLAGEKR